MASPTGVSLKKRLRTSLSDWWEKLATDEFDQLPHQTLTDSYIFSAMVSDVIGDGRSVLLLRAAAKHLVFLEQILFIEPTPRLH